MSVSKLCYIVLDTSSDCLQLIWPPTFSTDEGAGRKRSKIEKLLQFDRLHVTKQIESSRKHDRSQYVKVYEAICTPAFSFTIRLRK